MNMPKCLHIMLFFILTGLGLTPLNAIAQTVQVESKLNSTKMVIGDQLDLQLSARFNPQTHRIQWADPADTFNHFEVLKKGTTDTTRQNQLLQVTRHYTITSFDSGQWEIPALDCMVQPLQGDTPFTLQSNPLLVQVQTIAVDTSQPFKGIMAIRPAALPSSLLLKYILYAVAGLLLLAFIIWYIIKTIRKNKRRLPAAPMQKLQPHEKALQQLVETEKKAMWQKGDEKLYYTTITDTLRTYLEEQFGIDCFEKTSAEIIQQVKRQRILNPYRQVLRELFQLADLVKFAKAKPTEADHLQIMEQAKIFVQESYKKTVQQQSMGQTPTKE